MDHARALHARTTRHSAVAGWPIRTLARWPLSLHAPAIPHAVTPLTQHMFVPLPSYSSLMQEPTVWCTRRAIR